MRIFAYDRFKPGVTLETIEPYLPEEVAKRLAAPEGRDRPSACSSPGIRRLRRQNHARLNHG
jgi:hypothetical protein